MNLTSDEEQWIVDWDYKRILPDISDHSQTNMDMMEEEVHALAPLSISDSSLSISDHDEQFVFWFRSTFETHEDCMMDTDSDSVASFGLVPFEEISSRDFYHSDQSHKNKELSKSNEALATAEDEDEDSIMEEEVEQEENNTAEENLSPTAPATVHDQAYERQQQLLAAFCQHKPIKSIPKQDLIHRPPSPVCVSERITRAGMDSTEYQHFVTKLCEDKLMDRQRKLLKESMERASKTRDALKAKSSKIEGYERADKVSQVLKSIESSSWQIQRSTLTLDAPTSSA